MLSVERQKLNVLLHPAILHHKGIETDPRCIALRGKQLAVKVHQAIGCEGYSRVDMRLDRKFKPYVLEINTLPGMTETSLLPKAAQDAGIGYDDLVERILASALKKSGREEKRSR